VRAEASVFGINVLPTTKQELFPLGSLPFVTVCGTLCVSAGLRASVQGEHTERALAASPSLPPSLSLYPSLSDMGTGPYVLWIRTRRFSLVPARPPGPRMARPSVPHPASHDATQSGIRSVPELYSR